MRGKGFTLVEVMLASAIGIIAFAAVTVVLTAVWKLVSTSSDELRAALKARSMRDRIVYAMEPESGGLLEAVDVDGADFSEYGFIANVPSAKNSMSVKEYDTRNMDFSFETVPYPLLNMQKRGARLDRGLIYVYLAVRHGRVTYLDRVVVPKAGDYLEAPGENYKSYGVLDNDDANYIYQR